MNGTQLQRKNQIYICFPLNPETTCNRETVFHTEIQTNMQFILESLMEINNRRQIPKDNLKDLQRNKKYWLVPSINSLRKGKAAFPSSSGNLHMSSEVFFSLIVKHSRFYPKWKAGKLLWWRGRHPALQAQFTLPFDFCTISFWQFWVLQPSFLNYLC